MNLQAARRAASRVRAKWRFWQERLAARFLSCVSGLRSFRLFDFNLNRDEAYTSDFGFCVGQSASTGNQKQVKHKHKHHALALIQGLPHTAQCLMHSLK